MGKWDSTMKDLFNEAPEDMVTWIIEDAKFIRLVSPVLEGQEIYCDILCEIRIKRRKVYLHIEFQKKRDGKMAERLWTYNVRATIKYKYPVWSCVIYLTKDSTVEAFFCKTLPDGRPVHRFDFSVVKMWEIPTEHLLSSERRGLAPLLVLTHDGQSREVVQKAIEMLTPPDKPPMRELLMVTYGLASLMLKKEEDQHWLDWEFGMLFDILADTPAYRRMGKKYLEQGREQGLEQGREQGLEQGLANARLVVLEMIEARFADPALADLARASVATINDLETLRHLVVKVALLQKAEEVTPLLAQFATPATAPSTGSKRTTQIRRASRKQATK